jgi:hypothetical protein
MFHLVASVHDISGMTAELTTRTMATKPVTKTELSTLFALCVVINNLMVRHLHNNRASLAKTRSGMHIDDA